MPHRVDPSAAAYSLVNSVRSHTSHGVLFTLTRRPIHVRNRDRSHRFTLGGGASHVKSLAPGQVCSCCAPRTQTPRNPGTHHAGRHHSTLTSALRDNLCAIGRRRGAAERVCYPRVAGLEVLCAEQDFRRYQSVQNARKAAI